jgi:hypothetical protein
MVSTGIAPRGISGLAVPSGVLSSSSTQRTIPSFVRSTSRKPFPIYSKHTDSWSKHRLPTQLPSPCECAFSSTFETFITAGKRGGFAFRKPKCSSPSSNGCSTASQSREQVLLQFGTCFTRRRKRQPVCRQDGHWLLINFQYALSVGIRPCLDYSLVALKIDGKGKLCVYY